MNRWIRVLAHWLFGPYRLYRVYGLSLDTCAPPQPFECAMAAIRNPEEVALSDNADLRRTAEDGGEGSLGFGAWVDGELAAICWYWYGKRYKKRNFWPLQDGEAKLVQVTTAERYRGRGIAPALMNYSAYQLKKQGFRRLFARVWWSNRSSMRAFTKAGWTYVAYVADLFPFGLKAQARFVFKKQALP